MNKMLLIGLLVTVPAQAIDVCAEYGSAASIGAKFRDSGSNPVIGRQLVSTLALNEFDNDAISLKDQLTLTKGAVDAFDNGYESTKTPEQAQKITITVCKKYFK